MRNLENSLELRASLCGSIANGATAVGAPVDTLGFGSVLAVLVMGGVAGTNGNTAKLDIKIQESASATGTGANWTDVTDGTIEGTWALDQVSSMVGTDARLSQGKLFDRISDGKRSRYIRAHATCAGTDSASPKYSVAFLLGNPIDTTAYVTDGATQETGNVEFTLGL